MQQEDDEVDRWQQTESHVGGLTKQFLCKFSLRFGTRITKLDNDSLLHRFEMFVSESWIKKH